MEVDPNVISDFGTSPEAFKAIEKYAKKFIQQNRSELDVFIKSMAPKSVEN